MKIKSIKIEINYSCQIDNEFHSHHLNLSIYMCEKEQEEVI